MMRLNHLYFLEYCAVQWVVFCGDWALWIRSWVVCERYRWPRENVHQVLDYTFAEQNLQELVELLPARLKDAGAVAKRCGKSCFGKATCGASTTLCARF